MHVVLPDGVDDPQRPSGGNTYDRRVCDALPGAGWQVREHPVPGGWPLPDAAAERELARTVAALPDGAVLLVDGLVGSAAPAVLVPEARRLRLVVLVHLPLGAGPPGHPVLDAEQHERAVLQAARAVVATSAWSRDLLLRTHPLDPDRVHVAGPGVEPAPLAPGTPDGGALLCVAAVTWHKGHDLLLAALSGLADLPWRCVLAGSLEREPELVAGLRQQAAAAGLADRLVLAGPLTGRDLDDAYAGADVLVLPSRGETHGMVVDEALARGLPVVAAAVGGVPDALGRAPDGALPGLLVPAEDPDALATALRRWLTGPDLRRDLRRAAAGRRDSLAPWSATARRLADVLDEVAA